MFDVSKIADWPKVKHLFSRIEVNAKTTLLKEGVIADKAYLIEKGCIRLWLNNNGKDVTVQFFFEGDAVSSCDSFKTQQPSTFSIETIEPCILLSIDRQILQNIIDKSPEISKLMEEFTFKRLLHYQKLFIARIKDTPEKRYLDLLKNNSILIKRVQLYYIASYLGITRVSLSRIRNKAMSHKKE